MIPSSCLRSAETIRRTIFRVCFASWMLCAGHTLVWPAAAESPPELRGSVRDCHGAPVSGVLVSIRNDIGQKSTTTTDEDGAYSLATIPPAASRLVLARLGFEQKSIDIGLASETRPRVLDAILARSLRLAGRVIAPTGEPIRDVVVTARPEPHGESDGEDLDSWTRKAATTEGGEFSFEELKSCSNIVVEFSHPDFVRQVTTVAWEGDQRDARLDRVLARAGSVRGTVVWGDRRPVAGLRARLRRAASSSEGDAGEHATVTAADGVVLLTQIPPGRYRLDLEIDDGIPVVVDGVVVSAGRVTDLESRLITSGTSLRGQIVGPSGDAVSGALVQTFHHVGAIRRKAREGKSDESGRFTVSGLQPGLYEYKVVPSSQYARTDLREVTLPSSALKVVLERAASCVGVFRYSNGEFPESAITEFRLVDDTARRELEERRTRTTLKQGMFDVQGLRPGDYILRAFFPSGAVWTSPQFRLDSGSVHDCGTVVLDSGAAQDVAVSAQSTREPLEGASVSLTERQTGELLATMMTDASGRAHFDRVSGGRYTVDIRKDPYALFRDVLVVPEDGSTRNEAHYYLDVGGAVNGYVREVDETAVRGARIEIGHRDAWLCATHTDEQGYYFCGNLPSGDLFVRRVGAFGADDETDSREVRLDVGRTIEVNFTVWSVLNGEVRRAGAPVAQVRVTGSIAQGAGGTLSSTSLASASSWTDSEGRFRLNGLRPGAAMLFVEDGLGVVSRQVQVPADGKSAVTVTMPAEMLRGRVTDSESGSPIVGALVMASASSGGAGAMILTRTEEGGSGSSSFGGSTEYSAAYTGANGEFALWVSRSSNERVRFAKEGFLEQDYEIAAVKDGGETRLARAHSVTARIMDQCGGGQARLVCLLETSSFRCTQLIGPAVVFRDLAAGDYALFAAAPGAGFAVVRSVRVSDGATASAILTLKCASKETTLPIASGMRILTVGTADGYDLSTVLALAGLFPSTDLGTIQLVGFPGGDYVLNMEEPTGVRTTSVVTVPAN